MAAGLSTNQPLPLRAPARKRSDSTDLKMDSIGIVTALEGDVLFALGATIAVTFDDYRFCVM
jgi:hypothetical protein